MSRTIQMLSAAGLCGGLMMLAGNSVSYFEESLPTTMNPLFARNMADFRTHELVFDRLFFRSAITNELKSKLVTQYQKLEDGKKLKVVLKSGVKWHDGKSLGPKDICFTVDAMLNPKTPSPIAKSYRESIVGCEAFPKDNSAVIEFVKPYHNLRERVSFAVLPAHSFESTAVSPDMDFSRRPVGTGAMKAAKGRQAVSYTAFPNAHQNARIGSMSAQDGGDPFVQVRTLLTGGVQGLIAVAPAHRPGVRGSDEVALKSYDLRSWWFIALNTTSKALSNPKIRQALNLTIDREQLREVAVGIKRDDANSPCEFVSGPFVGSSPYYNRSVKPTPTADLARAEQLMTEAGAVKQAGRWLYENEPITLRLGMNTPLDSEAKDLLNQIGNQLQEGGFDRQVRKVNTSDWTQSAITGRYVNEYDALIGKWSFGLVEEVNPMFHTRGNGRGSLNIFNYSNPRVDELLAEYDAARTDTAAQDAYHELHKYLAEDLPYLFLWKLDTKSAWRNEIRNNTISPYFYFTEFEGWRL